MIFFESEKIGFPHAVDPVTGAPWWHWNVVLVLQMPHYAKLQHNKRMDELIPIIRWVVHGAVPAECMA